MKNGHELNASLGIKRFASEQENDSIPILEPFLVLSSSQLQEIITRAIQPLQDELQDLKDIVAIQGEKIATLEATQDTQAENELNMLRLINDLRKRDPGKMELSRAEKIEKYLKARPDHKATFETLKGHLQLDNSSLNHAINALMAANPGGYSIHKPKTGDKRKRTLVMLPSS